MIRQKTAFLSATVDDQRETLYECPSNCRAKVPLVFIANVNGAANVTFEAYKASSDTRFFILSAKSMTAGEYLQLSDGYIVLEQGDKLEITADGTTPRVDALATIEEEFKPV